MKKILGLILCGVLVLGITGCGNNNESESNNNSSSNNENNKVEEQVALYDEVIECNQKTTNSYINYYLKNDSVIEVKRYTDYRTDNENISEAEFEQGLKAIKLERENAGFKNVEIVEDGILLTITEVDTDWTYYSGKKNDVYQNMEKDFYEAGYSCVTK